MNNDYTPKPGDKVTSTLLVGEWVVLRRGESVVNNWWVERDSKRLTISGSYLTPVAPPLPPEPPVGDVVWVNGRYWQRAIRGWSSGRSDGLWRDVKDWSEIAADAVPVVPVNKAADWIRDQWIGDTSPGELADDFRAEFGEFKE